jgi:hypothetical protein
VILEECGGHIKRRIGWKSRSFGLLKSAKVGFFF